MTRRGGFTLLEVVLAVTLGSLILAGALSLLIVVQRAQQSVFARADANSEIARTHRTMQRTFTSLMLLPTPPANPAGRSRDSAAADTSAAEAADPDAEPEGADLEADEEPPPLPRLRLAPDPRFPQQGVQRLDVVLSSPPVPADPTRTAADAWAAEILALDEQDDGSAGLRGAFVLTAPGSTPLVLRDESEPDTTGWTLWWLPSPGTPVQIASGLRQLTWTAARSEEGVIERLTEYTATYAADLPDFMEVELEMASGVRSSMMFEVQWSIGDLPEPEEPDDPADTLEGDAIESLRDAFIDGTNQLRGNGAAGNTPQRSPAPGGEQ